MVLSKRRFQETGRGEDGKVPRKPKEKSIPLTSKRITVGLLGNGIDELPEPKVPKTLNTNDQQHACVVGSVQRLP